jgi:small-conductance mechanosensitive channel
LDERRRDLEQMVLTATRSIKILTTLGDARKALEKSRTEDAAWTGFTEKPPYSVLMIDELLNERDAIKANLTSSESSLANYERLLASLMAETKTAEETVSSKMLAVQNADDATREAAKWRLDAARLKARVFAARTGLMQSSCDGLKDRIAAATADLALTERKVKTARASSHFNDEDLAKLEKIAGERKKSAQKEIDAVSKRLKSAMTARNQAQSALDALVSAAPQGTQPEGLELAKFGVEVAEGRVDAMQSLIEGLESLIQLENISYKAYQDRKAIIDATSLQDRAKALASLELLLERLRAWENVADNDISASGADLSKLEARAASITSDDPRFSLLNEQRAIKSEKLAMLQRVSQVVIAQRKLIKRWVIEYSPKPGEEKLFHRVTKLGANAWETVKKVWAFEVMSFEDKLEVDGQTITGKIPVTLGMLLRALLFFIIGYWVAARIANRIQRSLITRGHIAEAQAKTLRNWAMIVVGVFLVLGTLAFLKIPLTVFAFFGGALAIGLGFGMQTLIKNFISGIIVLAERKVRVGDILDVDGIVGTVVEVNTRSSIIRSPDDVETMIPNSVFLENRVTNWTLSTAKMRRKLTVGVAYGTEPRQVMEILTESAGRHGKICKEPAPFAVFDDFGDNALIFSLYFWVDMHGSGNAMVIASDLRLMIEKRFTEAGIGIPFPQRDMHLTTDKPIQVEISNPPS